MDSSITLWASFSRLVLYEPHSPLSELITRYSRFFTGRTANSGCSMSALPASWPISSASFRE